MLALFIQQIVADFPTNYALRFNGSGILSLGRFSDLDNLKKFTFSFWMHPDEWTSGACLIEKGYTYKLTLADNNCLQLQISNQKFIIKSTNLTSNKWTHIAIMNSDEKLQILINNAVIHEDMPINAFPAEELPLYVGQGFKGRIDELRIYNNSLSGEFNNFWQNTLNDLNPQWNDLLGYYKFDQFTCANVVDYKGKNHGTMSEKGVSREIVEDNDNFRYKSVTSYINFRRFGWANLDMKKFQLTNTIIIISGKTDSTGNAWIDYHPNNAEFKNTEYVAEFKNRKGCAHFKGNGASMNCGIHPIENGVFTFGTWIFVEEWIEGSIIVKKYLNDEKGFYVKLGSDKTVQLHIGGKDYFLKNRLQENSWTFFAFSVSNTADSALEQVKFVVGDWHGYADEGPEGEADANICDFSGMSNVDTIMGENFKGYYDETALTQLAYNFTYLDNLKNGLEIPDWEKYIPREIVLFGYDSCWKYDNPDNLGLNILSWKEQIKVLMKPYIGRRGYRVLFSWQGHPNWTKTLNNVTKREMMAQKIADIVNSLDYISGADIDFEYAVTKQEWIDYGEFLKSLKDKVNKDKIVTVAPHAYHYEIPIEYYKHIDYYWLQCYGPETKDFYTDEVFVDAFNRMMKYGMPREKLALSYGTTTTWGFLNGEHKPTYPDEGTIKLLMDKNWTRNTNHTNKDGYDFYFSSFNQVYFRSQYMREMGAAGIMYWDTISDVKTNHSLSQAKASSFALEGNVDLIVDKVENAPPVPSPYPPQNNQKMIIIAAAIGGGCLLLVVIIIIACCVMKKRKNNNNIQSLNTLLTQ